ncbi:MAG: hypothetical protein PHP10_03315 [Candidatus Omnitrophica bacterium]|nr:hypothetical protein [Candidatus Omnitrophota bacterium]
MNDFGRYLYRGVSEEMHRSGVGLQPKGSSSSRTIIIGERHDGGDDFVVGEGIIGDSKDNTIIGHQHDSSRFSSSGVSTTPFFERAKIYATFNGKRKNGFVYKIDRILLTENGVVEYRVADYTQYPKIPEDNEVVLVGNNNGTLPQKIVIEVISVE